MLKIDVCSSLHLRTACAHAYNRLKLMFSCCFITKMRLLAWVEEEVAQKEEFQCLLQELREFKGKLIKAKNHKSSRIYSTLKSHLDWGAMQGEGRGGGHR